MSTQNRIDDLMGTLLSDGRSICDFCRSKFYCDELTSATKPPMPRSTVCEVFDIDMMNEAIDKIVHREDSNDA